MAAQLAPERASASSVTPSLTAGQKGFAALLQDRNTGKILAAGKFETGG